MTKFSLVLPTMNEVEGLKATLPLIDRSLFHEIILVDGGSTDGTLEFARQQNLHIVMQPGKCLFDAQEEAYRVFTGDVYVEFTPDGNSLPDRLGPLIEKMKEGHDMVIVSRYLAGAKSEDDDFLTALGNWLFTAAVRLLFRTRITDSLVAYRAFTREAIERMRLMTQTQECWLKRKFIYLNSWELGSSARAGRVRLRVAEIPGDEPKRIGGVRKLSIIKNGLGGLIQLLLDFFTFWPGKRVGRPRRAAGSPASAANGDRRRS